VVLARPWRATQARVARTARSSMLPVGPEGRLEASGGVVNDIIVRKPALRH
jgi:hypothetical protein